MYSKNFYKKLFLFITVSIIFVMLHIQQAIAIQSNTVCTRVGKNAPECTNADTTTPPPGSSSNSKIVCPIPSGKITCGPSKPTHTSYPACNEGHCSGDYCPNGRCPDYCYSSPATDYAIDIPAPSYSDVLIPAITLPSGEIHTLTCNFVDSVVPSTQAIHKFQCKDDQDPKTAWWIQFHHMIPGSQPKSGGPFHTGDPVGGKIDPDRNSIAPFPHVHVQIGKNGLCAGDQTFSCVPANQYLKC